MTNAWQEQEPHAIVELAIFAVDPAGGAQYRAAVEAAMKNLLDKPDLRVAVISLVTLSKRLDDSGHDDAAEWLLDVATSACGALRQRGAADRRLAEDLTRMKTERFRSFSDRSANVRAPKYGAAAAPGTVQLKTLLPPARRLR